MNCAFDARCGRIRLTTTSVRKPGSVAGQRQVDLRHAAGREAADDLVAPEALDRVVAPR